MKYQVIVTTKKRGVIEVKAATETEAKSAALKNGLLSSDSEESIKNIEIESITNMESKR